jgi:excisionase family DNA binding protein
MAARQAAQERCRSCQRVIGYDQPFYSESDARVHSQCLEKDLIKKLKSGLPDAETRFLTTEETAALLRVEADTIRNWVSQQKIPFRKAGGMTLFLLSEILNWTMPASRKQPERLDSGCAPRIP